MSGALLDTSVVIAAGDGAVALPATAAISVITLGELRAGVDLARTAEAREVRWRRLRAASGMFLPLDVDRPIAERYGEILALARREGRAAKAPDILIIATARATNRTLVTLDERQARLARAVGTRVAEP